MKYIINKGFEIIIVTNQRGVSRGIMNLQDLNGIHGNMIHVFEEQHIKILDIFSCTHNISDHCLCRKPKPGMLLEAQKKYKVDFSKSYLIGDSRSDIEAANKVHVKSIFLSQGNVLGDTKPEYIIEQLENIRHIL